MATSLSVIRKFIKTLANTTSTGTAAVDEAMKAVGATSYTAFKAKFSSDRSSLSNQDFLEQICGVRIYNKDTGAITGSDAGSKTVKTAESIIPESTEPQEISDYQRYTFTQKGLTVHVTCNSSSSLYEKQKLFVRALYNWWVPESLDLINESLGINFTDGRASINEINVEFTGAASYIGVDIDYDLGRAGNITLKIGNGLISNMTINDKNGVLSSKGYIDSTLYGNGYSLNYSAFYATYTDQLVLHALTMATLTANVPYIDKLPKEIALGLIEIVGGYDSSTSNLSDFLNSNSNYGEYYGYTLMRYLAKNYDALPEGLSYDSEKTVITASTAFTGNKIDLAEYEDSVETVDVSALTNGVNIIANTLANSLVGGKGADTLSGGAGNDTLTGGAGNDVFIYTNGKDVIADYASGDKISVGGAISKATVSGNDVVFTIGSGTLTVRDGKGKSLSMIDAANKSFTTVVGGGDSDTIITVTKSPVTLGAAVKVADASKMTSAVQIAGNTLANSIVGGNGNDKIYGREGDDTLLGGNGNDSLFGGDGNDVLSGGAGADTLKGGGGKDRFVYSAGKDVIADYATGDVIKISNAISKAAVSGNDVVFTIGSGTLTVRDGKGKSLSMIDAANKSFTTVVSGSSDRVTLTNSDSSPYNLDDDVVTVDATARTRAIQIAGNTLANSIVGGSGNDKLYGREGNDTLLGGNGNDSLFGGDGNDVLSGGAGADILKGGGGKDRFVYSAGKDVIADYESGDVIKISNAISKAAVSGNDVVFTIGSGTLTVRDGKGKSLSMIDAANKSFTTVVGGGSDDDSTLTITNATRSPVTLSTSYKNADASSRTTAVKIFGNSSANEILGGNGNDTLYGAAGDDTLWGGAGSNTFLYIDGDGRDVIGDFGDDDMLLITGAFTATYKKSAGEISFKVGSTSDAITLGNVSAAGNFNVNGFDYHISGTKLVRD